ncbi:MAG TPA: hypothetical protein VL200_00180 [Lacunisphaera sp.]|jgi:hypothetical protein|nr:hypothetical protein [Lacunisphaera sp.]
MNHETSDASPRLIATVAAVLVVGFVLSLAASVWVESDLMSRPGAPRTVARQAAFPPGPAEAPEVVQVRRRLEAAAAERLRQYGWVDRPAGVARIPLQRAMDLVVHGVNPVPGDIPPGQQVPK